MTTGPNLNSFTLKENIEDMKIFQNITVKDIYEIYNAYKNEGKEMKSKDITFFNCNNDYFSFEIKNIKGIDILNEPIEIQIENKSIFIICDNQLKFIKDKYKIDFIICQDDNSNNNFTLFNLKIHKNHKFSLHSSSNYKTFKNQKEIDGFLNKFEGQFINTIFQSPQYFEKNYEYYFNINKKNRNNFRFAVFEDKNSSFRYSLVRDIINWEFGVCYNYYGSSGTGKSITLIGALKYGIKDKSLGTFYINCKILRVLIQKDKIKIMKQILIDEIVFLLRNKYKEYQECCEKVKNFVIKDEYDFWYLIEDILEYINKIENHFFIIAFDQYNNENDINSRLKEIKDKYLKTQKFRIIVFSSINESDIREKMVDNILNSDLLNDHNNYVEIKKICSDFNTNFNLSKREAFELLGKTMKAYNELNQIEDNDESDLKITEYLEEKRKKILFKFYWFYKDPTERKKLYYGDNTIIDFSEHMGKILSFIPNKEYSRDNIIKIIDNIPFRFFDIEKKESNYIVKYSFPIIEQILIDIYKDLILKNSFSALENITKGSGAFGCIFKYAVIFYIIEKSKSNDKKLFNHFNISKNLTVKKFVLKENEKIENLIFKTQKLDIQYDYIIDQEVFCGKTLDFLLIRFINTKPYVYGFQVSIYKPKIYNIDELIKSYEIMRILLNKYFGVEFEKDKMFFGYIFNYEDIKSDKYAIMLNRCDEKFLKYCFFEPNKQQFLDKNGEEIDKIDNIVSLVFTEIKIKPLSDLNEFVLHPLRINYPQYKIDLNNEQYKAITTLVKKRRGNKCKWEIRKCTNYDEFVKVYLSKGNYGDYFYICYNEPYIKLVFFNEYSVYNLLFSGDIEKSTVDNEVDIYVCQIQLDTNAK